MSVTDLHSFRNARQANDQVRDQAEADEPLVCACGGMWFELRWGTPGPGNAPIGVTMSRAGRINGYTGIPHCLDCGAAQEV